MKEFDEGHGITYESSAKFLADIRRKELADSLNKLGDRELVNSIAAHFNSHPTLPGEKDLKIAANRFVRDAECNINFHIHAETRADMTDKFAATRIRESKVEIFDDMDFSPDKLKMDPLSQNGTVSVSKVDVTLMKAPDGDVCVMPKQAANGEYFNITIGKLPDKFITNNPMLVDDCKAELQVTDYSDGKMKNISMRVVIDTDVMSGDVQDFSMTDVHNFIGRDISISDSEYVSLKHIMTKITRNNNQTTFNSLMDLKGVAMDVPLDDVADVLNKSEILNGAVMWESDPENDKRRLRITGDIPEWLDDAHHAESTTRHAVLSVYDCVQTYAYEADFAAAVDSLELDDGLQQ